MIEGSGSGRPKNMWITGTLNKSLLKWIEFSEKRGEGIGCGIRVPVREPHAVSAEQLCGHAAERTATHALHPPDFGCGRHRGRHTREVAHIKTFLYCYDTYKDVSDLKRYRFLDPHIQYNITVGHPLSGRKNFGKAGNNHHELHCFWLTLLGFMKWEFGELWSNPDLFVLTNSR